MRVIQKSSPSHQTLENRNGSSVLWKNARKEQSALAYRRTAPDRVMETRRTKLLVPCQSKLDRLLKKERVRASRLCPGLTVAIINTPLATPIMLLIETFIIYNFTNLNCSLILSVSQCSIFSHLLVLPFERVYLDNLPSAEMYERSYMHRDIVTHVICTK